MEVKSSSRSSTCGHYDLDTEKSSEECIVWLDTRRSGKSSVWKRDGVKRSCSRSRSAERHAAGKRAARQRRGSRSRSRSRGRRKHVDSAPGNWGGSRYGLPSPAVYWAQAAPGWVPELPRVSRSAAASEGPTPGAWVPPSMEKRESPDADPDPPSQLALPAPNLAGGPDDFLGAPLMPRMPIAHAAPVKVLPPPPLVDEMEEFDKLLLQIEAHDNGGSILARSAASTAKPAKESANGQGDVGASHRPAKSSQEEQLERREFEREERERIQREREKAQREKEQKESEQREKEQRAIQQREEEKKRLEKSQPVPKVRQRGLPAPRQGSAVKVELIEDEKDQVAQPAQAPQVVRQGPAATSDPARDPRTRPSRSNDPRLQDDDAETTVKVLVDPYLEHVEPEEETALSVEVLRQPKAQAIPKRQRKAAPKKAIAKHPPSAPLSTPLTPAPFQEKKLLEIKQLLQRETQPMAPTTPPPGPPGLQGLPGVSALPGLPGPPMAPSTPRTPSTPMTPAPAPEDDAQKRLMAYSMLLLGGGEDDNEEAAPWKKKRRRAVGVDL